MFAYDRVLLVDVLAGMFGLGAWLGVNGMYTQLPILLSGAPESWQLASYIVILIQAANIGCVVYAVAQKRFKDSKSLESGFIYSVMTLGCLSLLLMAFFYREVVSVAGTPHSVPLFVLVFSSAFVACTSSVLFLPYMNRFKTTYLVSYMIGEGLSAFLPSIISLVQGVGGNPECRLIPGSNPPAYQQYTPPPKFSTKTYLLIIFALEAVSLTAFAMLELLPACRREKQHNEAEKNNQAINNKEADNDNEAYNTNKNIPDATCDTTDGSAKSLVPAGNKMSQRTFASLLAIEALLMAFSNGLFPSLQTYSCEPYGNLAYHLAINLGAVANPLSCYLLYFVKASSLRAVGTLTTVTLVVAVYILVTATMSPTPPFVGTQLGEALVVIVWVVFTGLVSYTKLAIATMCRQHDKKGLFWWGAVTQVGSLAGAVLGFVLLQYTTIFHSYQPCSG